MFADDTVGHPRHVLIIVAKDNLAPVLPGHAGDAGGGENGQQPLDLAHGLLGKVARSGDQDRGGVGTMFSLAEQVGGADFAIDGLVRDHHGFSRPGKQVDADSAEQLALGFRNESVAWADEDIDRAYARGAQSHGANCLDAAKAIDFVRPRHRLRSDDCASQLSLERRCASDDAGNTGDLGSDNAHMCGSEQRVLAAGNIATCVLHRDGLVAQHNARQRLNLRVSNRRPLDLREIAHLGLGKFNIVDVLRAQRGDAALDFGLRQPVAFAVEPVEPDA